MSNDNKSIFFESRTSVEQVEEGTSLAPKFNNEGLIPVTTSEWGSGLVLMMGFMNNDALILTIESGFAHYWSRSRKNMEKGETSGMYQSVKDLRIDDDQRCNLDASRASWGSTKAVMLVINLVFIGLFQSARVPSN